MPNLDHRAGLFPALLKHWRRQRGLSQLDLALAADVSSRHVSFLETGRSSPSPEMVLRLATTLGIPLRHVNAMLEAAGHERAYPDPGDEALPAAISAALARLAEHHDPYPLVVIDHAYRVRSLNQGATALFAGLLGLASGLDGPDGALNLAEVTFSPVGAQPHLVNFDEVGRALLWRIQREVLADPEDGELREVLDRILAMPTVDPAWRDVDLSAASDPVLVVRLRMGDRELAFLTMVTAFQAPQNVAVEALRIETWLPSDEATAEACRQLVG